jgi:hypothetical protein
MPVAPYVVSLTGLSSSSGFPTWFPDIRQTSPFNVSVAVVAASSSLAFSVQHSLDYPGPNSSGYGSSGGWNSTAANWFNSSGISGNSCSAFTNYSYAVSAIRLNSTAGSSLASVTMTIVQSG